MTQEQMVLKHLKDYGSITSWEAIMEYGITRLSAKIYNLRKDGYKISNETITKKNRYGKFTHFNKYKLEDKEI